MNNKGFTLVEVLIMLTVLAVLMAITIPNISGILANNKETKFKSDVTLLIDSAKVKCAKAHKKPPNGGCLYIAYADLNDNGNISKGPNGNSYTDDSFVLIKSESKTEGGLQTYDLKYYVQLIEKEEKEGSDTKYFGTKLKEFNNRTLGEENTHIFGEVTGERISSTDDENAKKTFLNNNGYCSDITKIEFYTN